MKVQVGVSVGELIDKLTILEIKLRTIKDTAKWVNLQKEWVSVSETLVEVEKEAGLLTECGADVDGKTYEYFQLINRLRGINQKLWDIEDELRDLELQKVPALLESYLERGVKPIIQKPVFYREAKRFVELARLVYYTNDERSKAKKELDMLLGSELTEEKSYKEYRDAPVPEP
jgi:hypothetical protein